MYSARTAAISLNYRGLNCPGIWITKAWIVQAFELSRHLNYKGLNCLGIWITKVWIVQAFELQRFELTKYECVTNCSYTIKLCAITDVSSITRRDNYQNKCRTHFGRNREKVQKPQLLPSNTVCSSRAIRRLLTHRDQHTRVYQLKEFYALISHTQL